MAAQSAGSWFSRILAFADPLLLFFIIPLDGWKLAGTQIIRILWIFRFLGIKNPGVYRSSLVGAKIGLGREAIAEVIGQPVEHVERRQAVNFVQRAVHAGDRRMPMRDVSTLGPRTNH